MKIATIRDVPWCGMVREGVRSCLPVVGRLQRRFYAMSGQIQPCCLSHCLFLWQRAIQTASETQKSDVPTLFIFVNKEIGTIIGFHQQQREHGPFSKNVSPRFRHRCSLPCLPFQEGLCPSFRGLFNTNDDDSSHFHYMEIIQYQ
jgi:hypothetical protein